MHRPHRRPGTAHPHRPRWSHGPTIRLAANGPLQPRKGSTGGVQTPSAPGLLTRVELRAYIVSEAVPSFGASASVSGIAAQRSRFRSPRLDVHAAGYPDESSVKSRRQPPGCTAPPVVERRRPDWAPDPHCGVSEMCWGDGEAQMAEVRPDGNPAPAREPGCGGRNGVLLDELPADWRGPASPRTIRR